MQCQKTRAETRQSTSKPTKGSVMAGICREHQGYVHACPRCNGIKLPIIIEDARTQLAHLRGGNWADEVIGWVCQVASRIDGEWGCCHEADAIRQGHCDEDGGDFVREALAVLALSVTETRVRQLLGKRVRVTLDKQETPAVIVTGTLLAFGDGGDFEVLDDSDGFVHYCWPMLSIEEIA